MPQRMGIAFTMARMRFCKRRRVERSNDTTTRNMLSNSKMSFSHMHALVFYVMRLFLESEVEGAKG